MPIDIYALCPCGSGKKFKFCCHALGDEMDRIIRLLDGNQPHVALQQLDQLAKKHPKNAWVGTTRGMLLLELNEATTARDILLHVLEEHPDNEMAIVLYAAAMIRAEGFEKAKRALNRAFQRSAKKLPALVGDLASSASAIHTSRGHLMAAREYLALALRLAPEDRRQQLFVQLLELDGADDIPYPLRGSHQLPNISGSDEFQKEVRKGQKYAAIGCWNNAADVFNALANAEPDRPELWHVVGLCRAWDGDEKSAAEALHRAARHFADEGIAIECETIAQLLDFNNTNDVVEQCEFTARTSSVSRVLTALDGHPRFQRLKASPNSEIENPPVAEYLFLDRDRNDIQSSPTRMEDIPHFNAQIAVFDVEKGTDKAPIKLSGLSGPEFDEAKVSLTPALGELIEWASDIPQPQFFGMIPSESLFMETHWYLPEKLPIVRRREFFNQFWTNAVNEKWMHNPQRALSGKSPAQAAADPALRVPLLAAIYVLDSMMQMREKSLGVKQLCERMGVTPLAPLDVTSDMPVGALSIMQLHRLPPDKLTDEQLVTVVNRSMLVRRDETLYHVLKEAVNRPGCAGQFDLDRILRTLSELCASEGRRDEAFSWLEQGRNLSIPEGKSAFQHGWAWDMAEFGTRLEDPSDPGLKALLNRFTTYYAPKVPQIRPHIEQTLRAFGVPSPWESIEIITADSSASISGVWNPQAPEPVSTGAGKLWLPGQ
jgi:tetratricopeptide (TPR) repeat protein